jgi:excinuclease ABC subunit A
MDKNLEIEVRGARVNNLKNLDIDVPLGQFVAITGVSGSGKSSLAMGVLYAEGSRRYLEALSTYSRRRLSQESRTDTDEVRHIPSAIALHQRPTTPNVRSTVGTMSETFNVLRLMMSRLGSHRCPNGHHAWPTMNAATMSKIKCQVCEAEFEPPSAESFSFNAAGACETCGGTGVARTIDDARLIPDENLTLRDGAVKPWTLFGRTMMSQIVEQLGVRIDVPYRDLTEQEKEIVLSGAPVKRHIHTVSGNGHAFDLNFTYENARLAAEKSLAAAQTERGIARLSDFFTVGVCQNCHGSRLNEQARSSLLIGKNLAEISEMTLDELMIFVAKIPGKMPAELHLIAKRLVSELNTTMRPLIDLGLGYLTVARDAGSLSTGELQRIHLARTVRSQTTGVLYVLDEPSVGLHPQNIAGLVQVIRALVSDGNSVVMVDHDINLLSQADYLIEIGPGAGAAGGEIVVAGMLEIVKKSKKSRISRYLTGEAETIVRQRADKDALFDKGKISLAVGDYYNLHGVAADIPLGRLTTVTGVSGSGKTNLILESLVPAVSAQIGGKNLPGHIKKLDAPGLCRVVLSDAVPIGHNTRSTVATYSGVLDDIRRLFAATPDAKKAKLTPSHFSYNSKSGWCETCRGLGEVSLDVQFLPDMEVRCPDCAGQRYNPRVLAAKWHDLSIYEALCRTIDNAIDLFADEKTIKDRLELLSEIGLGYLTLGEATPALSGGEAGRLKLRSEMTRDQSDTLMVCDEPSIGLHPDDVRVFIAILDKLLAHGATIILIEHDLDLITNSDYIIDIGVGAGDQGGKIIATGTPDEIAKNPKSVTGKYLKEHLKT